MSNLTYSTFFFPSGNIKSTWRCRSRQKVNVLSFNTETKTKAPAISLLRAPSRSGVYCHTKISRRQSRDRRPLSRELFDKLSQKGTSFWLVAWLAVETWREFATKRRAGPLVRSAHVCQLRRKPVIGGSSIDYAATELNKGSRPFARPYMCRRVCAASHRRKSAPHRLPADGILTRKKTLIRGFAISDYRERVYCSEHHSEYSFTN